MQSVFGVAAVYLVGNYRPSLIFAPHQVYAAVPAFVELQVHGLVRLRECAFAIRQSEGDSVTCGLDARERGSVGEHAVGCCDAAKQFILVDTCCLAVDEHGFGAGRHRVGVPIYSIGVAGGIDGYAVNRRTCFFADYRGCVLHFGASVTFRNNVADGEILASGDSEYYFAIGNFHSACPRRQVKRRFFAIANYFPCAILGRGTLDIHFRAFIYLCGECEIGFGRVVHHKCRHCLAVHFQRLHAAFGPDCVVRLAEL